MPDNVNDLIKKISVVVISGILLAVITGSVALFKEFIQVKDWQSNHEEVARIHIQRIESLEKEANKGSRHTGEDQQRYEDEQNRRWAICNGRVTALERKSDVVEFRLGSIDDKLDEILEKLK